ncbi:DUF4870 domain-containing protein [Salirhabdus salicampi]|nr:DUF4870 domain-containing protein [Salirhabdus salicampi]
MLIYVLSFFTTIIGPLIVWLLKKDESEFIDFHGKQYFNFVISYFIYFLISTVLMVIIIGFVLAWVLGIAAFIFMIIAAIKTYGGERYKIPFIITFLK